MELFVFLGVFGAALAVRLTRDRRWIAWIVWLGLSLISFLTLMFGQPSAEEALVIVIISSVVGFIGPEIWQIIRGLGRNLRQSVIRFFSRPRNIAIVLFLLFFLYALKYQPELLSGLLAIAIMVFALMFIARPLWKSVFGSKKK